MTQSLGIIELVRHQRGFLRQGNGGYWPLFPVYMNVMGLAQTRS